jgi:hypothetical protein
MECYFDPNFESDNGNDEHEDAEDEGMGRKNDYVDEDRPVIHFDKINPTIVVGVVLRVRKIVDICSCYFCNKIWVRLYH